MSRPIDAFYKPPAEQVWLNSLQATRLHGSTSKACIGLLAIVTLTGCNEPADERLAVGNPEAGEVIVVRQACGYCHTIPAVPNSNGQVGPTLAHFASRRFVAGLLPNTPLNLVQWLRFPQAVLKGNAMPNMGLSDQQARDVAAYLYTLK